MKTRILLILSVSLSIIAAAETPPQRRIYPMRGIPMEDARFKAVFAAIIEAINREEILATTPVEMARYDRYAARGLSMDANAGQAKPAPPPRLGAPDRLTIKQTVGNGEFLADHYGTTIHIKAPGQNYIDGVQIRGTLSKLASAYQYTDTLGAMRTISSREFVPDPNRGMTPDKLIVRLKAGESFIIQRNQPPSTCKECNGFGTTPAKRVGDAKVQCRICHGKGKVALPELIEVRW